MMDDDDKDVLSPSRPIVRGKVSVASSRSFPRAPRDPHPADEDCRTCKGEGYASDPCDDCGGGH